MNRTNPKVDFFFSKAKQWQEEFEKLRMIVLNCGLVGPNCHNLRYDTSIDLSAALAREIMKFALATSASENSNIVLLHGFKEYCALLFHKGALLKDPIGILVQQTENVQAARQIRFTNVEEIDEMEHILKAYIQEAIEVEKAGLEVEFKETSEFNVPEEFQKKLDENPALKTAFEALTPGRQRGYLLYFSGAKQTKTREARVEKYMQHILNGKGLNDQ